MGAVRAALAGILSAVLVAGAIPASGAHPAERGAWKVSLPTTGFGTYVSAFKDGSAFAYDDGEDVVYVSSDFGVTWAPKDSPVEVNPPGYPVPSVFEMAGPRLGFFDAGETLYRTTNGASTWKKLKGLPLPGGTLDGVLRRYHYDLQAIDASDKGSVVAVGGTLLDLQDRCREEGHPATLWTSHDEGDTWFRRELSFGGGVGGLAFFDDLHGAAIATEFSRVKRSECGSSSLKDHVLVTKDGGKTWKTVKLCPHTGRRFDPCTAIGMASPKHLVVGTSSGRTYVSKNAGRSFKRGTRLHQDTPAAESEDTKHMFWVEGIDFANAQVGYASTNGGGTWMTSDGGITWSEEHTTEKFWGNLKYGDIAVADSEHAIAAGSTFVLTRLPVPEP